MKFPCRSVSLTALFLPLLLTGCQLLPTTRKLPVPRAPNIEQTISPAELVSRLDQRWASIHTLTATVEMQASLTKTQEGLAKDYPSVHGNILLRKPADLRVLGRYFGVSAFDMSSDGKCFTLLIPHDDKVIKGCGEAKTKSANQWENLRPGFFFDSMMVRGLDTDDHYSVTSETFMMEDAAKKHLFSEPNYILHITRYKPGSQEEKPARVVYFHRDDLQPYQQDIYDSDGNLETQVTYASYQKFEGGTYPSTVTIKRPIDAIQIVLNIDSVHENQVLPNDQFTVQIPSGDKVQTVE